MRQWLDGLEQRHGERQDQGEMTQLGNHAKSPPERYRGAE